MKAFWIHFKTGFTDLSEGKSIREAVERLGLKMTDVADFKEITV